MFSCQCVPQGSDQPCGRTLHLLQVTTVTGRTMICCLDHLNLTWGRMDDAVSAEPIVTETPKAEA